MYPERTDPKDSPPAQCVSDFLSQRGRELEREKRLRNPKTGKQRVKEIEVVDVECRGLDRLGLGPRMAVIYLLLCSLRRDFGNSVSREVSLSENAFRWLYTQSNFQP